MARCVDGEGHTKGVLISAERTWVSGSGLELSGCQPWLEPYTLIRETPPMGVFSSAPSGHYVGRRVWSGCRVWGSGCKA